MEEFNIEDDVLKYDLEGLSYYTVSGKEKYLCGSKSQFMDMDTRWVMKVVRSFSPARVLESRMVVKKNKTSIVLKSWSNELRAPVYLIREKDLVAFQMFLLDRKDRT